MNRAIYFSFFYPRLPCSSLGSHFFTRNSFLWYVILTTAHTFKEHFQWKETHEKMLLLLKSCSGKYFTFLINFYLIFFSVSWAVRVVFSLSVIETSPANQIISLLLNNSLRIQTIHDLQCFFVGSWIQSPIRSCHWDVEFDRHERGFEANGGEFCCLS